MMDVWHAVILGIVEGVTEFLPISSTGHLILASRVLGLEQTEFLKTFEIAIQLGAILAVLWLYRARLVQGRETLKKIFVAFLPTALVGFVLYKLIKDVLFERIDVILWVLVIGGVIMILTEIFLRPQGDDSRGLEGITYRQAFFVGVCQSLAVVPGVSRAASTILGGLAFGIPRRAIVEFSFLLAVPTMLAATGFDLLKSFPAFSMIESLMLILGFLVAFLAALASIRWLLKFIERHTFIPFGIYRILLGIGFLLLVGRMV